MYLLALYRQQFAGRKSGRYRISRKFLRQLAGRRRMTAELLVEVANELFEQGYVLIDLETYFVVLEQRLFNNYRRVTVAAIGNLQADEAQARAVTRDDAESASWQEEADL
jgi:hypothetical protein